MRDYLNALGRNDSETTTSAGALGMGRRRFIQAASVVLGQASVVPVLASCTGDSPTTRQGGEQAADGSVAGKLAELANMSGAERQQFLEEQGYQGAGETVWTPIKRQWAGAGWYVPAVGLARPG